jgi:hypothetical protein
MSTRGRFLGLLGLGIAGAGFGQYATASPENIFMGEFVVNIEDGQWHSKWVRQYPDEANLWEQFRDEVGSGQQVTPPVMSTTYGKALVAAGKMHMVISAAVA